MGFIRVLSSELLGQVSHNYFVENIIQGHSAANFVRQIQVVNGFVKLAPYKITWTIRG